MNRTLRVLIVEDSEDDARLIVRALDRGGFDVETERVETGPAMQAALARQPWDLVIADYALPQFSGFDALEIMQASRQDVPFILVSGTIGEDLAVEAMRRGAHDYLMKDRLARIVPAVARELREAELRREQRQAEQSLRRAERLAALGTFAAGIAHEIKNPITSILLNAGLAAKAASVPSVKQSLREIAEDAERCAQIVTNVLRFARREPTEKTRHDLNDIARQAAEHARRYILVPGVGLTLQLASESLPVQANPPDLEQALLNLISNAVHVSCRGQEITLSTQSAGGRARVCVADQGRGMSSEQAEHVFDPFYTTREREGGTGLGLTMAHASIEDHGGTITLDTAPGAGTRVIVEIPLV